MLPPTRRLHYFDHQFLRVADFSDEQAYHLGMRRAHNRLLHTPGVAQGLSLSFAASQVTVARGVALDGEGREIVLDADAPLDLSTHAGKTVWITLSHDEQPADSTSETGVAAHRRWEEGGVLRVRATPPPGAELELVLGRATVGADGAVTGVDDGDATARRRIASAIGGDLDARSLHVRGEARVDGGARVGGRVGIGVAAPEAALHLAGGSAALGTGEGDLKIGTAQHRLKIGVATGGAGAGDARIHAHGGTGRLLLGSGGTDVVQVQSGGVGVGMAPVSANGVAVAGGLHFGAAATPERQLLSPGDGVLRWQAPTTAAARAFEVAASGQAAGVRLEAGGPSYVAGGFLGVGVTAPEAPLHVSGGRDVATTEGDLRVGTGSHRLKIGVTTTGATAGEARLRAEGAAPKLILGVGGADVLTVASGGVGIGAAPAAGTALRVGGAIDASEVRVNGAPLVGTQWEPSGTLSIAFPGNVGVGGPAGTAVRLNVNGTVNATEYRLNGGTVVTPSQWSNVTGGIAYTLSTGKVGIGDSTPWAKLTVAGSIGSGSADPMLYLYESGTSNPEKMVVAHSPAAPSTGIAYRDGGDVMLFRFNTALPPALALKLGDAKVGIGTDAPASALHVRDNDEAEVLMLEHTGGTHSWLTLRTSEGSSNAVSVVNRPGGDLVLWVSGGHDALRVARGGAVSIPGKLTVGSLAISSGAKPGYVFDHFVNRTGDPVEQGDVVVIGESGATEYWSTGNHIPIPEIDLAASAYDTRVCGIVDRVVTERELPFAEAREPAPAVEATPKRARRKKAADADSAATDAAAPTSDEHPLRRYGAPEAEGLDPRQVGPGQMGSMVTLGAYAHCKVDADIAPVRAGDLLTTSPTRGHAQKVLDPAAAAGSILGKALASLEKGKGKIPVMVLMQ